MDELTTNSGFSSGEERVRSALQGPAACLRSSAARCIPYDRQPLLVISPYGKVNKVDHTATEQESIARFIENNWRTGRVGDASFDERAGSLTGMFD